MIRVSIVDDSKSDRETLLSLIEDWNTKNGNIAVCKEYSDALIFLNSGITDCDIIFMDIQMPYLSGMDAAEQLRSMNTYPILIFLTMLSEYAVRGYSVDAMDYIIKPIKKEQFTRAFEKACKIIETRRTYLMFSTREGTRRVAPNEIQYIEAFAHKKVIYLGNSSFSVSDDMGCLMEKLPSQFVRCHRSYIVNVNCIQEVGRDSVKLVGKDREIPVSRSRRDELLEVLAQQLSQGM